MAQESSLRQSIALEPSHAGNIYYEVSWLENPRGFGYYYA
jgi:hypothetical protein